MLGLRRGIVRLEPHDPEWLEVAAALRSQIRDVTGIPVERIQHIGSTCVPDLPAKPIIDIDVGLLESEDLKELVEVLVSKGFIDRGYKSEGIGHFLVWEPEPGIRTVHVHIVPHDSKSWRTDLAFRDALLRDPSLRRRYAALKAESAERFGSNRRAYRLSKQPFFEDLAELGSDGGPNHGAP